MRRISLAAALVCAVAASGCSGGAKSSTDAGGNPGIGEGTFKVTVQNTPPLDMKGGRVTSNPSGIDCGVDSTGAALGACEASFTLGQAVTLTATATGAASPDKDVNGVVLPYRFYGWAGDCSGEAATCTLSGAADKYVLATFAGKRTGHPNWSVGTVHAAEYSKYFAETAGALDCASCHGAALQGLGLAVSCGGCHAAPATVKATIAFSPAPPTTGVIGEALSFSALATDPGGKNVTCTWSFAAKPVTSQISLATSGTCSGTPGSASITPDAAGVYVVRVAPSNQPSTAALEATIVVAAEEFGGGDVAATTDATPGTELGAIATRLNAVLAIGKNTITADALATRLMNPKKTTQTPINIVDVRDPEDFAKGHIPGAINVPLAQLPSVLLVNPSQLPATELAIASYNGGDGNMATLLINAFRYDGTSIPNFAVGIMGGMTTWSFDRELSPTRFDDDRGVRRIENGAIATGAVTPDVYQYPSIDAFTPAADDVTKKILVRAAAYLRELETAASAAGTPHREAFWTTFKAYEGLVSDSVTGNEPQVLSVRGPADFTRGHVPGAINIAWQKVAQPDNMKAVDPSREVFVYCYTGHTGGQATMALGILGYKARNLLYGINGWTADRNINTNDVTKPGALSLQNFDATRAFDFPQHDWPNMPSSLVGYVPPRASCKECHSSQTAQWYELVVNPVATGPAQPASEGEG